MCSLLRRTGRIYTLLRFKFLADINAVMGRGELSLNYVDSAILDFIANA